MTTGASVQLQYYKGLARAAAHMGTAHTQYRGGPSDPLASANALGTLNASFNIAGKYSGQTKTEQPLWQVIADATQLQIGDYLVGNATWCVVMMDQLLPPLAIRCPHLLTFTRPAVTTGVGALGYAADVAATETSVAANVPAYLDVKTLRGSPPTKLPGDAALRSFVEAFVYLPDGTLKDRDVATDENGRRYQVTVGNFSLTGYTLMLEVLEA